MRTRQWRPFVVLGACLVAAACGGATRSTGSTLTDGGGTLDTSRTFDATSDVTTAAGNDSGPSPSACIPGRSVACVGPGGCSSNQVCNDEGTAYGPCECAQPIEASTPPACVPGQSIACTGPGGCIANQVCNAAGTGYGACTCSSDDGSTLLCIPGQSIECSGPGGCFSSQVCNSDGRAYGACVCVGDSGSVECQTAADCENLLGPLASLWITDCPGDTGGSASYLHYVCVLGVCQTTYCG